MLLKGRGTPRQFSSAVSFFQLAAKAGHPDAVNSLTGLESKIALLSSIGGKLTTIAPGAPALERKIALKRAVEDFILGRKQGNEIEKLTITHHDILMVFNDLAECIDDGCPDEMKAPWHDDIASLLQEGANDYHKEGTRIHTGEATLPLDLWLEVGKYMSMGDNINLTRTATHHKVISDEKETGFIEEQWNKFMQFLSSNDNDGCKKDQEKMWWYTKLNDKGISHLNNHNKNKLNPPLTAKDLFFSDPAYRKDRFIPSDKLGIKYLKDHKNITDRILLQKIRDGEFTLAQIEEGYKAYLGTPLAQYVDENFKDDWMAKSWVLVHVVDGSLTSNLHSFNPNNIMYLTHLVLRNWFDNNPQYLNQILSSPGWSAYALTYPWIQARVLDGLIPIRELEGITSRTVHRLSRPGVQHFLNNNPKYFQQVLNSNEEIDYCLGFSVILDGLINEMITFEQLTRNTQGGRVFLKCRDHQFEYYRNSYEWLRRNPQHLSQVLSLSENAAMALYIPWVRTNIGGIISFYWLNSVTKEKIVALNDPVKQKQIEQDPSQIDEILGGTLTKPNVQHVARVAPG
jgi:hypothetical protein